LQRNTYFDYSPPLILPNIKGYIDYYPFGSAMNTRSYSSGAYRYGFNGKEKDSESFNDAYDFGARIYDGRLGRFLSVDPLYTSFCETSTYSFGYNSPISFIDHNGESPILPFVKGAVISGMTEFSFQMIDIYMTDPEIEFTDAIAKINKVDMVLEALAGGAEGAITFGFSPRGIDKFKQLFKGQYRKITMYLVRQSIEVTVNTVNKVIKKYNSGEINTSQVYNIIGETLGEQIKNEITGAMLDKRLLNKLQSTKKKYNNHIDNVIDLKNKQKDLSKKLAENPNNKKINRQLQNNSKKIKKETAKAVNELNKQYKRLNGGLLTNELIIRAEQITDKVIKERRITSTAGTIEYENIDE
jgi:RHS repeat-associated protein